MKPLNYAILKYFTKVDKASAKDVVEALKPEYGSFRALNEKAVLEALLTGVENGLLEEAGHTLDENNNVVIYFHAPKSGVDTINSYIKD
ncbi:MAG TPA: hypothetical protein H9682_07635 [Firmicutes bacterium]|nr:hypothetical protein [Bacillota bacterium]